MHTITLSKDKTTKIDEQDIASAGKYAWRMQTVNDQHYAVASSGYGKTIYLHRLLVGAGKGDRVKHLDGDTLNNQRSNLQLSKNAAGVQYVEKGKCKWRAGHFIKGKRKHLGVFETEEEAKAVRHKAEHEKAVAVIMERASRELEALDSI